MIISFNINVIFFAILFVLSMFIGSIRTPIGPIRIDFVFDFVILSYLVFITKKINIHAIKEIFPFLLFFVFYIFWLPFKYSNLNVRDILFIIIPIYSITTYYVLSILCKRINLSTINKFLKIYIIVNFIFALLQYTNLFGLNSILDSYYSMLSYNNASTDAMVRGLAQRPFGLTGNPTYLTFTLYLTYKLSTLIKKSKFISLISWIAIIISGGRMVMFFAIIWEIFEFIYKQLLKVRNLKQLCLNIIIVCSVLVIFSLIIILTIYFTPFLKEQIWERIANKNYFDSYSYTYRFQMYLLLLESNIEIILWGGFSYDTFFKWGIKYVDSEYVMRILQFGIFGFFCLVYPYIHFCKKFRNNIYSLFLLLVCLSLAITNFSITNYALIFYIVLYMVTYKKLVVEKPDNVFYNKRLPRVHLIV